MFRNREVKVRNHVMTTDKATLGWKVVYEIKVWFMPHHGWMDNILEIDFMILTGVRL